MTEKIEHGFWHKFEESIKFKGSISRVDQYKGDENLFLACTQLGTSVKYQQEVINGWCDLFNHTKLPVKKLWVTSRISQRIFDAICCQDQLEGLWIKWGVYPDISNIAKLANLQFLHLGGGASISDLSAIIKLKKLASLETDCLYNISNYSFLSKMKNIIDLSIEGDPLASMKKVTLNSLQFLEMMPQLQRLNLTMTKIEDHSYLPVTKIKSLKYLSLPKDKDLESDFAAFSKFNL